MPPDVPFGSAAERYDALRPSYPGRRRRLGPRGRPRRRRRGRRRRHQEALTSVLLGAGRGVRAIDPSDDLLRVLRRRHPDAQASVGIGERTGLPDDSVAAVVYGQSWHWVDGARATAEASGFCVRAGRSPCSGTTPTSASRGCSATSSPSAG